MSDLIERKDVQDMIALACRSHDRADVILAIRRGVKNIPAVDAAPVAHGHWIDIPDRPEWDQKMCSVCNDIFCCQLNYCPNCGSKNGGEE